MRVELEGLLVLLERRLVASLVREQKRLEVVLVGGLRRGRGEGGDEQEREQERGRRELGRGVSIRMASERSL